MAMKFLPHRNKENTMLVNIIYHRPTRDTEYKDYIDIVYKDLDTNEKFVETIETPEMEFYFTKEQFQDYNYNKSFIELDKAEMHKARFKDLPFAIARLAGPDYQAYLKDCLQKGNRSAIRNMHKHQNVFGSDYDMENWMRIQWVLHNHTDKPKPITRQYCDIEVDSIDIEGFPTGGNCPINAITLVDKEDMTSFTFLLRNDKNPQIKEFEEDIESFVEELHEAFDETYGTLDYRIYMYDDELQMIKDLFKLVHTLKRDFLMFWNGMGFDIPFIMDRLEVLGVDPKDVFCHKDFKVKELYFKKDTRNFAIPNKSDFLLSSSYTKIMDDMLVYAGLRKGQGEMRSYSLNAVASTEIGDKKLDYGEEANIKTLPYVNFKKFVMYNIKDVLLELGIGDRTQDIENLYQRSYTNATKYDKIFKQTVFLKNRAYIEYYRQGLIIGNNINIEYVYDNKPKKIDGETDEEDEKFDGALVADPMLNEFEGIMLYGNKSMFIFDNVVDMDFSSMYPNIIIAFNIAPNCMVGKLIIDRDYLDIYNDDSVDGGDDMGKEFVDNMLIKNIPSMGTKWFSLPDVADMDARIQERFGINKGTRTILRSSSVKKTYAEKLLIDIRR